MMEQRMFLGRSGELAASHLLLSKGYRIVDRNWSTRLGELDIVCRYKNQLVFVEVRSKRKGSMFGTAVSSVDIKKQRKVRKVAQTYIQTMAISDLDIRFDVIGVEFDHAAKVNRLCHVEYAF